MTDIDLDALEAVALRATPGPWVLDNSGWSKPYDIPDRIAGGVTDDDWTNVIMPQDEEGGGSWSRDEDAKYIAAFDPPTVLALIARLREAEAVLAEIRANAAELLDADDDSYDGSLSAIWAVELIDAYKTTKTENGSEETR